MLDAEADHDSAAKEKFLEALLSVITGRVTTDSTAGVAIASEKKALDIMQSNKVDGKKTNDISNPDAESELDPEHERQMLAEIEMFRLKQAQRDKEVEEQRKGRLRQRVHELREKQERERRDAERRAVEDAVSLPFQIYSVFVNRIDINACFF